MSDFTLKLTGAGFSTYPHKDLRGINQPQKTIASEMGVSEAGAKDFSVSINHSLELTCMRYLVLGAGVEHVPKSDDKETNNSGWGGDYGYKAEASYERKHYFMPKLMLGANLDLPFDDDEPVGALKLVGSYYFPYEISSSYSVRKADYLSGGSINVGPWDNLVSVNNKTKINRFGLDVLGEYYFGETTGMGISANVGFSLFKPSGQDAYVFPHVGLGFFYFFRKHE